MRSFVKPAWTKPLFMLALTLALAMSSMSSVNPASAATVKVKNFAPTGQTSENASFRMSFGTNMVQTSKIGRTLSQSDPDFPFTVTPSVQLEGKWRNPTVFTAAPLAPLKQGTSYTVTVRDGLKDRRGATVTGGPYKFNTGALTISPVDVRGVLTADGTARLTFNFSMPVDPARFKGFLTVKEDDQQRPFSIQSAMPSRTIQVHVPSFVWKNTKPRVLDIHVAAGLTGNGDLGLTQDFVTKFTLRPEMKVTGIRGNTGYNEGIQVNFNFDIDFSRAAEFVMIDGQSAKVTPHPWDDSALIIPGDFKPRERHVVTLRKGFPAQGNQNLILKEDFTQAVIMPDLEPNITLPSAGTYLSTISGGLVPIELTNVSRIQVDLWHLYENNIPYVVRSNTDYYDFPRDLTRRVYSREFDLSALPRNERVRRSLALDDMLKDLEQPKRGMFLLTVRDLNSEYWNERGQILTLSDIGAVARVWDDGLLLWVNTLSGAAPIKNAIVKVYSGTNQLLAEGKTDKSGVFVYQRDAKSGPWGTENGDQPRVAVISSPDGNDFTYVELTRGLLSREIFDTAGRPWLRDGYDAMLFAPRDIYRTGESVPIKIIVRNPDVSVPKSFPVLLLIRDPMARTVNRELLQLTDDGTASYTLNLPANALTGLWNATVTVPGREDSSFGYFNFHVEDFAPPRIEVKLASDVKRLGWSLNHAGELIENNRFTAKINSKYLFGAPGTGLPFKVEWSASAADFKPTSDRWTAYNFGDPSRKFTRKSGEVGTENQALSDAGTATIAFNLSDELENSDWLAPTLVNVTLRGEVQEDSGRWVSDSVTRQYWFAPWLLGIVPENDTVFINQDAQFRITAIDANEEPVDVGELTATLSRVTWNYNMVEIDGHRRWQSSEEFTKLDEKTITFDGASDFALVSFKPQTQGNYIVSVSDENNTARAVYRFYATDPSYSRGSSGSSMLDRVGLTMDKEQYSIGDKAHVTFSAPFKGLMLVTVENAKVISRHVLEVSEPSVTLDIPVTRDMLPNAWVTAWLIRPITPDDDNSWGAHRAIGISRLKLDLTEQTVDVELKAPSKIEPAKPLPVTVKLKSKLTGDSKPVTGEIAIALVDDAVLNLTGFKTPDLLNHFYGLKQLNSEGYDFYDQLIPVESRATEILHPAGGMAMAALAGAGSSVQRFKILSLFEATLTSDANGVVNATLDVPEFSGRGKLFAVVNAGNRFGKAEQLIQIARNVVTEVNMPRFAAPGDKFIAPVTVFNRSDENLSVKLAINAEGLTPDETNAELDIAPHDSVSWSTEVTVDELDTAKWEVVTSWTEAGQFKEFTQAIDLPVRSPYPVISKSGSGVFENGTTNITIPVSEFSGLNAGKLTLADTPVVDLTRAVNYLSTYPYGCLEQTISAAWPFMTLGDAIANLDPLLVNDELVLDKTKEALARIQTMQLYDGSFAMWPGGNATFAWGSVYAAHFMTELRDAGVTVPDEMFKGVMNWLKQFLASMPNIDSPDAERDDFTTKAYAVYVLTLNGEKPLGWIEFLRENQDQMWPSGKIWLAGSEARIAGRGDALRTLGQVRTGTGVKNASTLESDVRNTAQLLSIWMDVEPNATEVVELATRLTKQGQDGQWYSTQDNAQALMALAKYNMRVGTDKAALKGTLAAANKKLLDFTSGKPASIALEGQPDTFTLDIQGTGRGYYSWTLTGTPKAQPNPEERGLTVECLWLDDHNRKIDLSKPLSYGTKLKGILTVKSALPVSNIAVSCLLPAGLELDNPRIGGADASSSSIVSDVRDDRLLLFFNRLDSEATYAFSVRAVTMGAFAMPPISATGMYDPSVGFIGTAQPKLVIE